MKIIFFDFGDEQIGSTRIWVNNLSAWLRNLGEDVQVFHNKDYLCVDDINADVIFFGKNTPNTYILQFQKKQVKIGIINPSFDYSKKRFQKKIDFILVGSLEERDFWLDYYSNVFIFPLIENMFHLKKIHQKKDQIVFGYHGNLQHLQELSPNIQRALEQFSQERKILLKVIFDHRLGSWKKNRPRIEIQEIQWSLDTLERELLECDIGLVPGVKNIINVFKKKIDYIIGFKNKSNAGRAFVFHQLNIPVISDFVPSNFHILGDPHCGFIASSFGGWVNAMRQLEKCENREQMADCAYQEYTKCYDPMLWSEELIKKLQSIL